MDSAKYAELFRQEAREHLAEMDTALLALERGVLADEREVHVATLFRATHTIKGMAAAMGYRVAERLSHALESLLDETRAGAVTLGGDTVALLFDGTDALGVAIADASEGEDQRERPEARAVLDRLVSQQSKTPAVVTSDLQLGNAGFGDAVGAYIPEAGPAHGAPDAPAARVVEVTLRADTPLKGVRASLVLARLAAFGTASDVTPPADAWQRDDFDGTFRVRIATAADAAELDAAARAAGEVDRVLVRVPDPAAATPARVRDSARTVRVDQRRLDTLLDLVGELVITRDRLLRRVEEASERGAGRDLAREAHETARLVSALQDEVLQARMAPVGGVFDRFPRLVRDVARELGKDVQFVMEGREIELDRSLLDAIGDPILHLLRNALDHGLEDAERRRDRGKPPTGRLVLRAARDRAAVVIQVEDDGGGIDRAAVMRRAAERGLAGGDEDPGTVSDERLLQTLAHSGLSTARAVTAISGRGVGVDVVATRVRTLGGTLSLETLEGEGTVFTMRLPATLAITRALLVQVGGETYALPAAGVVEALEFDPAMRVTSGGREGVTLRDEILPVVRLRERFAVPVPGDEGFLAVVESGGRRAALRVDALVAQQDVVVKPLDAIRGAAPWFSGATVLGDGTPALIVDLGSLL